MKYKPKLAFGFFHICRRSRNHDVVAVDGQDAGSLENEVDLRLFVPVELKAASAWHDFRDACRQAVRWGSVAAEKRVPGYFATGWIIPLFKRSLFGDGDNGL